MNTEHENVLKAGVRIAIIGVLAIFSLFLYAQTMLAIDGLGRTNISNVASITVTGTGKASVTPNIAQISFSVEEKGATGEEAQNKATKLTDGALATLKKLGVAEKDIKTTGYQVTPEYEIKPCSPGVPCNSGTGKILGYRVIQSVEVKIHDTSKTGEVLQTLTSLGVQNISGPNFIVDDESVTQAEARGKAIADARAKAETLASQLGVRLGKVIGFSENGSVIYPMNQSAMTKSAVMDAVAAPSPSIPVGQNDTNANVTVVYEIK